MIDEHNYRYPGARPFVDDESDRRLFFGREDEVGALLHLLLSNRLVVLFGKSGLGKTSLLQAGLFPRLREHDVLPIPVRVDRADRTPRELLWETVAERCRTEGIDYTPGEPKTLWEFFKTAVFWRGEALQTPALIFDQFEEVFTLQDPEYRRALVGELSGLVSGGLPEAIRARLRAGEKLPYTDSAPDVRILVSLREDHLGELQELTPELPSVFQNRFRLTPLDRGHAELAVVKPAQVENGGPFATHPFRYREEAVAELLDFLEGRSGEIEPFQLQILCRHVERLVERRQTEGQAEVEVDRTYLGGRARMGAVLRQFYLQAIAELPSRWQRRRVRRLCEEGLLNPEGRRLSLEEGQILREYRVRPATLNELVDARLLRKEPRLGSFYYEISHDSLCEPIAGSRPRRVPKEVWVGAAVVVLLGTALFLWQYRAAEQARRELARKQKWEVAMDRLLQLTSFRDHLGAFGRGPEMVEVKVEPFRMGDLQGAGDPDERPVHAVTLPEPFAVGRYEVTFREYDVFARATGRPLPDDKGWGREDRPVIHVSWDDAVAYTEWLSARSGKRYRLPTEAEWEYAARGGTETGYWWGNEVEGNWANCRGCGSQWDGLHPAPVGSFVANPFGLSDTAGNVWEWVQDCWHDDYVGAPDDGSAWTSGDCEKRVVRGGGYGSGPGNLRSAARGKENPGYESKSVGFRVVREP